MMIIPNSQQDVVINVKKSIKSVGLKISGGADSAILAYILALYKKEYRPDLIIHTVTNVAELNPFQEEFSNQVLTKITELTGVTWGNRYINHISNENATKEQTKFTTRLRNVDAFKYIFYGETKNPPIKLDTVYEAPLGRDGENQPTRFKLCFVPFKNINKKGIKELYDHLGVLEEIFPLTRSCEYFPTTDFSKHCEKCWFCAERYWGFQRYV